MSKASLLVSMNFEASKGGIARVARLMEEALNFTSILSYHGTATEPKVTYVNKNTFIFFFLLCKKILFQRHALIVFDHIGPASLLGFVPQMLLRGLKVVVFLHDEEAWKEVSARHKLGLNKATHILCNSDYTFKRFVMNNASYKSKTQVCLLGGIPSSFLIAQKEIKSQYDDWIKSNAPFVIFVSRLWKEHRYKGYIELIEAFDLHYQDSSQATLHLAIIGNGDDVSFIRKIIYDKNLEKCIHVFTDINDTALVEFYRHTEALIFPSTREGFGFVFLEAMYFSKPCIGIKGQPAEEIFTHGISGILLPDNKPLTILQCLMELETNPKKYTEIGKKGKEVLHTKFLNEHFKLRLLAILNYN